MKEFSNSIIIQFGHPFKATNIFPITYNKTPTVVAGSEYSWSGSDAFIRTVNINSFTAAAGTSNSKGWLAIGF